MRPQSQVTLITGSTIGIATVMARQLVAEGAAFVADSLADTLGPDRVRVSQMNIAWTSPDNEHETRPSDGLQPDWPEKLPLHASPSVQLPKREGIAEAALCCARPASRTVSAAPH